MCWRKGYIIILLLFVSVHYIFADDCKRGDKVTLQRGLMMKCVRNGTWLPKETKAGAGAAPCEDNPAYTANGTCSAERGHCKQFTVKGGEMDRDCAGTCDSCDGCRCQDNHQWHKYCSYWAQYCSSKGVLRNWMKANCKKTCGECRCKCCSYQGKQHSLGARIPLPEKCAELVCEEGLVADFSPLLPGASPHNISHPEELTLNFKVIHLGADCCLLPGDARSDDGSMVNNGSMVEEGWSGSLRLSAGAISTTCCHGQLCVPLNEMTVKKPRVPATKPPVIPCKPGFAGDGNCCILDKDGDGTPDTNSTANCTLNVPADNCPNVPNSGQEDTDGDGIGDACDNDSDGDGVNNNVDNCPLDANSNQKDTDVDKVGDVCDNCPTVSNPRPQKDTDSDGIGDACENDADNDNIDDKKDNCPEIYNPGQKDMDGDGVGDACDNCQKISNANQADSNNNMVGDACDNGVDKDSDGIPDTHDNCPGVPNAGQLDTDNDGVGDDCDDDDDNDGVLDGQDNCVLIPNKNQADSDWDGVGDVCQDDCDNDGIKNTEDICACDATKTKTDFKGLVPWEVGVGGQAAPIWQFTDGGKQINQALNSRATLAVGDAVFSSVRYTGTLFVDTDYDDDCVGFLFNYQDNKHFYLVTASKAGSRQGTWNLKRINSVTGHPSNELANAIWNFGTILGDVSGQTKLLYRHPHAGWKSKTPYTWLVEAQPDPNQPNDQIIFLQINEGSNTLVNETIRDAGGLSGGRLGVYCQSQQEVIWSKMATQCL